ncbi:ABC transporter substrate-binding protein [Alicyclobacillus fastidiosus]|uniref:ABC transporter substrate-binding protein n=1 Tax=Alicyclobacillus fastidiosus TaxID=392011 RepID=A0ABV5ABS8_9BACL|nr:ABC transporter substrate-binding protein [Alicyclobacillus fastidiosus]WEH10308.1 ABC transporter substrate-binding protein [Alicyclobacillus fastidiosus]
MRKRQVMAVSYALLAAVPLAVGGCNTGTANSNSSSQAGATVGGQPHEGGSITLDAIQQVKDIDPARADDTQSMEVVEQLYDQLVTFNSKATKVEPMIAKSWDISPDGKTYTFHLRDDAKFWNGDPVTAQSFIAELERVMTKSVGCPYVSYFEIIQGAQAFYDGTAKTISGASAPNKYTLVLKLTQPQPFFLKLLGMPFISAVDSSYIKQVGNDAFDSDKAMGSGPFELSSINQSQVVLKKNPNYWRTDSAGNRLPYLDQVTFNVSENAQADAMRFEAGQTAWLGWNTNGIPSAVFPTFKTNPKYSPMLVQAPEPGVQYLGMNTKIYPFTNPKVRQALEYAIDKKQILAIEGGRGEVANQPLPPSVDGYVKDLPKDVQYSYNPTKAKELLKQAGFPNGFTTTLYSSNDSDQLRIDTAIQSMLANVGVKVKVSSSTWGTFLTKNESGKTGLFWLAWMEAYPDASDFLYALFDTKQQPVDNSTLYSNAKVDAWLNQSQVEMDDAKRTKLFQQATVQIMRDAPWVPVYYPVNDFAVQPWVHNFYISPVTMDPLQQIWVDPSHAS